MDPATNKITFIEPSFTGKYGVKRTWEGFMKSASAMDNHRRYQAKCKSCDEEFLGIGENLIAHKKKCELMPEDIRKIIEDVSTPSVARPAVKRMRVKKEPAESRWEEYEEDGTSLPVPDVSYDEVDPDPLHAPDQNGLLELELDTLAYKREKLAYKREKLAVRRQELRFQFREMELKYGKGAAGKSDDNSGFE